MRLLLLKFFHQKILFYLYLFLLLEFHKQKRFLCFHPSNESRLKKLLQDENHEDAGKVIADLIIQRQLEKIKTRQQFKQPNENIDESEKW